jgi:hypothetical protein
VYITTLQQVIDERISFLKEQINPNNKPEVNSTLKEKRSHVFTSVNRSREKQKLHQ